MIQQRIGLRFITPAFLGDAHQVGGWRTPPLKALLRAWWRVFAARRCGYDHRRLRKEEGRLFGHAWLTAENGRAWAYQSRVRLRLESWTRGRLERWPSDPPVRHPEVGQGGRQVGAHLYLGYGPLSFQTGIGTRLKAPPAVEAGAQADLVLAYPETLRDDIAGTLQLMAWFGTVGGRSRNGWGSLDLEADEIKGVEDLPGGEPFLGQVTRRLRDCLELDWPHALGSDERGLLLWRTVPKPSWEETMRALAEVKIALRTQFPFGQNRDATNPVFENRHVLAYPVTNHGVLQWSRPGRGMLKQTERIANQLRFKVARDARGYVGLIVHVPCGLPDSLARKLPPGHRPLVEQQLVVWREVHQVLESRRDLQRV